MSLALVHSRARQGIEAPAVRVEVHLGGGLPRFTIVGMGDAAVRESRERVRAAMHSAGFEFPSAGVITVSLAPADLPKDGGRFDLPIALGLLAASGQLPQPALDAVECVGELALTGELRAVEGVLPAALAAARAGRALLVPAANAVEAARAVGGRARGARTLGEVVGHLQGRATLPVAEPPPPEPLAAPDLRDVRGQAAARRALEVAASGAHPLLFIGPPGCGKSMLAARLPGLLPPLDDDAALELAALQSAAGRFDARAWGRAPFRAPGRGASATALLGGGSHPRPGELSLAHRGVLFLDELPEWPRGQLELLREPMESGRVVVARTARSVVFPAAFQLVAAMNPCACGWAGDDSGRCRCGEEAARRYRERVSGPLLDRIDLQVHLQPVGVEALRPDAPPGEATAAVLARVLAARARQAARGPSPNARLTPAEVERHCALDAAGLALLEQAMRQLRLSARGAGRILRVARTLADLAGRAAIAVPDLAEAIGYRPLDRGA